jgi:hypothetical protein
LASIQIFPPTSIPASASPDIYNIWKGSCQYSALRSGAREVASKKNLGVGKIVSVKTSTLAYFKAISITLCPVAGVLKV